jgi:hypothetical protein
MTADFPMTRTSEPGHQRVVLIALLLVLSAASAQAQTPPASPQPGAATQSLPPEPSPVGPLRRGPNGEIEVVTPESERAEGHALCDKGALCVGEGQSYASLGAALAASHPGDTIDVTGGTYREAATIAVPRLTVRGTAGRPHFDCKGVALGDANACLAVTADGVKLDNLEVSGAAAAGGAGGGPGACLRSSAASGISVADLFCHDSETGFVASHGTIEVVHSEFYGNGGPPEAANGAFGPCDSLNVEGSVFRDARSGAEFVSRCRKTTITDTRFVDTASARLLDFPDGGDAILFRSYLEKTEDASGNEIVAFASESCGMPGSLALKEVRILNSRGDAVIRNFNRCTEGAVTLQDVTVSGAGVGVAGFINDLGGNDLKGRLHG